MGCRFAFRSEPVDAPQGHNHLPAGSQQLSGPPVVQPGIEHGNPLGTLHAETGTDAPISEAVAGADPEMHKQPTADPLEGSHPFEPRFSDTVGSRASVQPIQHGHHSHALTADTIQNPLANAGVGGQGLRSLRKTDDLHTGSPGQGVKPLDHPGT